MCREVCMLKMLDASRDPDFPLGGIGVTVEKIPQGQHVEGISVFGALQRSSETSERRMFMCIIPDRSAKTIIALITHEVVFHQNNLVDPDNGAHTNRFEGG
ncbi:hypothetical protein RF11_10016 [Thelohanellus kitauei]|uniref:Uncharacterized protein n=1 Tax=Thelohanellus kitauei TaxID=669202 RepID=A0A0C2MYA3_THEKT|nr:hypothetical protein RF11_10016 [Thelohanellus kitauei]